MHALMESQLTVLSWCGERRWLRAPGFQNPHRLGGLILDTRETSQMTEGKGHTLPEQPNKNEGRPVIGVREELQSGSWQGNLPRAWCLGHEREPGEVGRGGETQSRV